MIYDYDLEIVDEIDSTNNEAKRRLEACEYNRPFVIAAHKQTAGRGRQGRNFYSPKDTGIYLTLVRPFDCPVSGQVSITTRTAVAVAQAVTEQFGVTPGIKWVNDLYIDGRKICGILCEAVNDYEADRLKYAVIGVGVNVNTAVFPADIADTAGCIRAARMTDDEFEHFARIIAERILEVTDDLSDPAYLDYYREHSCVLGHDIIFTEDGSEFKAHAIDIDENGALVVEVLSDAHCIRKLDSGEISVRV
ncbi:MAG: biotin--[acetyl-CoA-carboxylase] ligase [Lachnospiraceae bacterium]|nr:biotin--[acetyl-CoA-carboxylase] ligase [Lachnospiraceae bacterium]